MIAQISRKGEIAAASQKKKASTVIGKLMQFSDPPGTKEALEILQEKMNSINFHTFYTPSLFPGNIHIIYFGI